MGGCLLSPAGLGLQPPLTASTSVCPCQQRSLGVPSVPGWAVLQGRALPGTPGFFPGSSVMLPWRLCLGWGDVGALALLPQRVALWRCGLFVLLRAQHQVVFWFCCSFGDWGNPTVLCCCCCCCFFYWLYFVFCKCHPQKGKGFQFTQDIIMGLVKCY